MTFPKPMPSAPAAPKPIPRRAVGKREATCGPMLRAEAAKLRLSQTPTKWFGRILVYLPENERPFVLSHKADGRPKIMRGELSACEHCGKDFFHRDTGRKRWTNCSKRCGGVRLRRTKRAISIARGGPKKASLDRWFSLLVRQIGACIVCGTTERLQCAHILSRRYLGVRYSLDNAVCLCARHHMYFTYRPLEWEILITQRMGAEAFASLKHRALSFVGPLDRVAIARELYASAKGGIKELGADGWRGWTGLRDADEK